MEEIDKDTVLLRKRLCGSEVSSQTLASIKAWHMTSI